jgi:hypothetical protein
MDDLQTASLAEFVKGWTEELERDAISLWHMYVDLKDFGGFLGVDLHDALRLGIQSLLKAGAGKCSRGWRCGVARGLGI